MQLTGADTKARLEDLYLPFKPKRRTKAQIAREAGLEPLADLLLTEPTPRSEDVGARLRRHAKGVATEAALEGARAILVERFAEHAELLAALRDPYWQRGAHLEGRDGKATDGAKFSDYFDFAEPLPKLPSHRILALFRGEKEEILDLRMEEDKDSAEAGYASPYEGRVATTFGIADHGRPGDRWLLDTVRWAWRTKLAFSIELDMKMRLWQLAEEEGVKVFAGNLRDLLLAAPAGARADFGLDPGFRTGVKVAVVDATGKFLRPPRSIRMSRSADGTQSLASFRSFAARTRSSSWRSATARPPRETDGSRTIWWRSSRSIHQVMVSEAGASVYSASALARQEFPDLD